MQARAQSLFDMLTGSASNLLGDLGTGDWFLLMTHDGVTRWSLYWSGMCVATVAITVYFAWAYHRVGHGFFRQPADNQK